MTELSDRARLFALEYLVDFNVGKAAARANLTTPAANVLMQDPRIQALIQEGKRKASERANISIDWVLEKLRRIADASPVDYFELVPDPKDPDKQVMGGMALANLPDEARDALKSIKFTRNGPEITTHDKVAALVHLGKYLGMFVERVELSGHGGGPIQTITSEMSAKEASEAYAAMLGGGS